MSVQQRWLIGFYAVVAVAALITTWGQNLQLMTPGMGLADVYAAFAEQTRANAASRSITVDIGFFLLAASGFMVVEARRLSVRLVWLYIVFGIFIAISFTFALFLIAREMRVAAMPDAPSRWSLTVSDVVGLALVAATVIGLSVAVLN